METNEVLANALKGMGKEPSGENTPVPEAPQAPEAKQEAPKNDTPAPEPNKGEDIYKTLSERTGGKITKEEDLNGLLGIHEKYGSLESELETYKSKTAEYEASLKEPKYANELVETLNGLYKNGATAQQIETFLSLQGKDFSGIDGLEAKTLRLMHEKGFTREQALEEIHDSYNLNEDKYDAEEVEKAKRKLERNKSEDVKYLEGQRKDASALAKQGDPEEQRRKEAERSVLEAQIGGFAAEAANKFKGIGSIELAKAKDGEEAITFEVKYGEDFIKQAPALVKQFMLQQGLKPGKEAEAQTEDYLKRVYLATHGEELLRTVAAHTKSTVLERETARTSNRSTRTQDAPKPAEGGEMTTEEGVRALLKSPSVRQKHFG